MQCEKILKNNIFRILIFVSKLHVYFCGQVRCHPYFLCQFMPVYTWLYLPVISRESIDNLKSWICSKQSLKVYWVIQSEINSQFYEIFRKKHRLSHIKPVVTDCRPFSYVFDCNTVAPKRNKLSISPNVTKYDYKCIIVGSF